MTVRVRVRLTSMRGSSGPGAEGRSDCSEPWLGLGLGLGFGFGLGLGFGVALPVPVPVPLLLALTLTRTLGTSIREASAEPRCPRERSAATNPNPKPNPNPNPNPSPSPNPNPNSNPNSNPNPKQACEPARAGGVQQAAAELLGRLSVGVGAKRALRPVQAALCRAVVPLLRAPDLAVCEAAVSVVGNLSADSACRKTLAG